MDTQFKNLASLVWQSFRGCKTALFIYTTLACWVGLHSVINSYLLKSFIDLSSQLPLASSSIYNFALLLVGNYEIHNLSWRGINALNLKVMPKVKTRLTNALFEVAHKVPFDQYQSRLSGFVAQNILNITTAFERTFSNIFVRLVRGSFQLVIALVIMGTINPLFALIFSIWTGTFCSISYLFSTRIRRLSGNLANEHSEVSGKIVDSLANTKEVRLFSRYRLESSLLMSAIHKWTLGYRSKGSFLFKLYFFQGSSITALIGCMLWGLFHHYSIGSISSGDFAFILSATFFLTDMVWANTELLDQLNEELGKCRSSFEIFNTARRQSEYQPCSFTRGAISLENIYFAYPLRSPIFKSLSVQMHPREKVGIVGHSGAGKSTLFNLLLGLNTPLKGTISIDGQDLSTVNQEDLCSNIGLLSQETSLFDRSIYENIAYGKPSASEDEILRAAIAVGLNLSNKETLHSPLGERGLKLSGGERQRVALARLILKNAPILLLDEPTAHLDNLTEQRVLNMLSEFMREKTVIMISHKLSALINFDRILVLNQGQIVSEGTHEELLKNCPLYQSLWLSQLVDISASSTQ